MRVHSARMWKIVYILPNWSIVRVFSRAAATVASCLDMKDHNRRKAAAFRVGSGRIGIFHNQSAPEFVQSPKRARQLEGRYVSP